MKKLLAIFGSLSFFVGSMTVVSCKSVDPGNTHVVKVTDDLGIILSIDPKKNPGSMGDILAFKNNHNNTFNLLKVYVDGAVNCAINKNVDRDHVRSEINKDWILVFFLDGFKSDFCRKNNIHNNSDLNNYYKNTNPDQDINVPISFKISALKGGNLIGEVSFTWNK